MVLLRVRDTLDHRRHAAIDEHDVPVDERRRIAREEYRGALQFLDSAPTSGRWAVQIQCTPREDAEKVCVWLQPL